MPVLQNLVLTDRAATPVAHTFTPYGITNGVAVVVESDGTDIGSKIFSITHRKNGGKTKTRMVLNAPIVQTETINGISAPKVVRKSIVDCTFTFDSSSSEQERKDVVGMFMSALDPSKVLVNDTIVKGQGVYGA